MFSNRAALRKIGGHHVRRDFDRLSQIVTADRLAVIAFMIYLVVTGLVFPLIYGANEIMNSIGRFFIAYYLFFVAAVLEAITPIGAGNPAPRPRANRRQ